MLVGLVLYGRGCAADYRTARAHQPDSATNGGGGVTPTALAARRTMAMRRVRAAADVFAEHLGVAPPDFDAIMKRRTSKEVVAMKTFEVLADWMESVMGAAKMGAQPEGRPRSATGQFLPRGSVNEWPPAQGQQAQAPAPTESEAASSSEDDADAAVPGLAGDGGLGSPEPGDPGAGGEAPVDGGDVPLQPVAVGA